MDYHALFQLATRWHDPEAAPLTMPGWAAGLACVVLALCWLVGGDPGAGRAAGKPERLVGWVAADFDVSKGRPQ